MITPPVSRRRADQPTQQRPVGNFVSDHAHTIEVIGGVVLGVAAAATGVGAIVEGATIGGVLLGAASVGAGMAATALDYSPCVNNGEAAACLGLGLGLTSVVSGAL